MGVRKGDILPRRPIAERLWEKVDRSGGPAACWIWTGGRRNTFGYGEIWSGGNEGRPLVTHRVAWEVTHGPVPEGMCLDHICKNAPCCNPAHLRVVTPYQNYVDYSDSPHGRNGRKTHCKYGHEFTPENTRMVPVKVRNKHGKPTGKTKLFRCCKTCDERRRIEAAERYRARKQSSQEPSHD